jgi:hypothetical protein
VSHSPGVLTKPGEVHRYIARAYAFGQANRCRIACKPPVDSVGRPRRRGRRWVARVRHTTHQPFLEFGDHPDGAETVGTDPTKFVIMWERNSRQGSPRFSRIRSRQTQSSSTGRASAICYRAACGQLRTYSQVADSGRSMARSLLSRRAEFSKGDAGGTMTWKGGRPRAKAAPSLKTAFGYYAPAPAATSCADRQPG